MATRAKKPTYRLAVRAALADSMRADPDVYAIGECIQGESTWGPTAGLDKEFPGRVIDTPISEAAIVGYAIGASIMGLRPVVEVMIGDFLTCCMDELVNQAAKVRLMSGGQLKAPIVVRAATGTGRSSAGQHSQSFESWFIHVPGLVVAVPSTAQDAYDMLRNALAGEDPTLIFEYKRLYQHRGEWVARDPLGPDDIGRAEIRRAGTDCSVVATGVMLREVEAAQDELGDELSLEIIDPRYLWPLDLPTLVESVERTGRLLVVEEVPGVGSFGAWLEAEVSRRCFGRLKAPPARLSGAHVPRAFAPELELTALPRADAIARAARQVVEGETHAAV